ncbi:MAG: zf-HC2 domain-containing protein [Acidobacteriia bacterium]|nr:zf-HC2 domain-containing protein [Terriglobia bacterium]
MEHEQAIQNLAVECYLLGEMSSGEREAFEEHYFECAVCAEDLRSASQFIEDAKDLLAAERPAPAPAVRTRPAAVPTRSGWDWMGWLRPQAAAAMIAALVVVAGVETFSTIPGLRRQVEDFGSPRVVKSTVLRQVTRGGAATVSAAAGEPVVLMFDPPESPEVSARSPLTFLVKSADGGVVFELPGEAPALGEQITLSVPRLTLMPGNYTLVVQTAGASGKTPQELGQYPFKLEPR